MKFIAVLFAMVWILPATALLRADTASDAMDRRIEAFAKAWKAETSPSKKRSMCIQAIDDGLIVRGESVKVIDRLFGTKFGGDYMAESEIEGRGSVYFSPQSKQDGFNQVAPVGWYLGLTWDKTRTILSYDLSNLHK